MLEATPAGQGAEPTGPPPGAACSRTVTASPSAALRSPGVPGLRVVPAGGRRGTVGLRNAYLSVGGHDRGKVKRVALDRGTGSHERPGADCRDNRRAGSGEQAARTNKTSIH